LRLASIRMPASTARQFHFAHAAAAQRRETHARPVSSRRDDAHAGDVGLRLPELPADLHAVGDDDGGAAHVDGRAARPLADTPLDDGDSKPAPSEPVRQRAAGDTSAGDQRGALHLLTRSHARVGVQEDEGSVPARQDSVRNAPPDE
jgi:hypothetical protein